MIVFPDTNVWPIYGPPGTGKTTTCVAIVSDLLERGVDPQRIAYVAFTNKAADEARTRVCQKLDLPKSKLPHFRTIHSLANRSYKSQNKDSLELMKSADYKEIGDRLGILVQGNWRQTEDGEWISSAGFGPGDVCINIINMARATCSSLPDYLAKMDPWILVNHDISPNEVLRFNNGIKNYKETYGKYDFNDMLDRVRTCEPLEVDYVIIDEAQDLSMSQWMACRHMLRLAKDVWVAGDDDQAIFRFSGADSQIFTGMAETYSEEKNILHESYRLPKDVWIYSQTLVRRIKDRVPKDFKALRDGGSVVPHAQITDLDLSSGDWLFLVRNRGFADYFVGYLRSQGWAFTRFNQSLIRRSDVDAIKAWEGVRRGKSITANQAQEIYKRMVVGHGVAQGYKTTIARKLGELGRDDDKYTFEDLKENGLGQRISQFQEWHTVLLDLPPEQLRYYRAAAKKGELDTDSPRIHINTIHGIKGGESENVVILPDMGRLTYDNYVSSMGSEFSEDRCAYVAATRAKEALHILSPINYAQSYQY